MRSGDHVQNIDPASDLYQRLGVVLGSEGDNLLVAFGDETWAVKPAALRTEAERRKDLPVFDGFVAYFPDAMNAVAEVSRVGNEQHNPGQPLHWAYGVSLDHKSSCIRHMQDSGEYDTDGLLHDAKAAWRAMANLQTLLEKQNPELHTRRQAQRDAASRGVR